MLKYIGYILVLMLSGIVGCAATEPGNIPLDGLNTNSFDIGEITDGEITDDLRHSTCTLRLADNKGDLSCGWGRMYLLCHHETEWEYNNIETDIVR